MPKQIIDLIHPGQTKYDTYTMFNPLIKNSYIILDLEFGLPPIIHRQSHGFCLADLIGICSKQYCHELTCLNNYDDHDCSDNDNIDCSDSSGSTDTLDLIPIDSEYLIWKLDRYIMNPDKSKRIDGFIYDTKTHYVTVKYE